MGELKWFYSLVLSTLAKSSLNGACRFKACLVHYCFLFLCFILSLSLCVCVGGGQYTYLVNVRSVIFTISYLNSFLKSILEKYNWSKRRQYNSTLCCLDRNEEPCRTNRQQTWKDVPWLVTGHDQQTQGLAANFVFFLQIQVWIMLLEH